MRIMVKSAWYDIEKRGRRLEKICKQMNTMYEQTVKDKPTLAMGYLDALLRTERVIQPYVEEITGLNRFLKKHERKENTVLNKT